MPLPFLSDVNNSDSIADWSHVKANAPLLFGRAHRDGAVRSGYFLLALLMPLTMAAAFSPAQSAERLKLAAATLVANFPVR